MNLVINRNRLDYSEDNAAFHRSVERQAHIYAENYKDYIHDLAEAQIFKLTGRPMTEFDVFSLGMQLEGYAAYEQYISENGSYSDLGQLPKIAMDTIVLAYGNSVGSILSSKQPIDDYVGNVYFKGLIAASQRGGINVGDDIFNANPDAANAGYWNQNLNDYASEQSTVIPVSTVAGTLSYGFTLPEKPIRKHSVSIALLDGNGAPVTLPSGIGPVIGEDNGNGMILGIGLSGKVDYTTGVVSLIFIEDPAAAYAISVTFSADFEKADDIPSIDTQMTSTSVTAKVFAVKQNIGSLQGYTFARRFGRVATDDTILDLSGAMASIDARETIKYWVKCANRNNIPAITHPLATPAGVSEVEHKKAFAYRISDADSAINKAAGRGRVNRLVCGSVAGTFVQGVPGFKPAGNSLASGPHILGTIGDIVVIRDNTLPDNDCYPGYISLTSNFEVPVVTGVYMPLFISNTMQNGKNPLSNARAAAMWAAYKDVVPQFVCKISLT